MYYNILKLRDVVNKLICIQN